MYFCICAHEIHFTTSNNRFHDFITLQVVVISGKGRKLQHTTKKKSRAIFFLGKRSSPILLYFECTIHFVGEHLALAEGNFGVHCVDRNYLLTAKLCSSLKIDVVFSQQNLCLTLRRSQPHILSLVR